jgi:uncharacterized Tic20 family protein
MWWEVVDNSKIVNLLFKNYINFFFTIFSWNFIKYIIIFFSLDLSGILINIIYCNILIYYSKVSSRNFINFCDFHILTILALVLKNYLIKK